MESIYIPDSCECDNCINLRAYNRNPKKELLKIRNKQIAMQTKKLKIKSIKPHTNFTDEISELQKTDKFLNRIFYTGCVIATILGIILLVVNLTR